MAFSKEVLIHYGGLCFIIYIRQKILDYREVDEHKLFLIICLYLKTKSLSEKLLHSKHHIFLTTVHVIEKTIKPTH